MQDRVLLVLSESIVEITDRRTCSEYIHKIRYSFDIKSGAFLVFPPERPGLMTCGTCLSPA